MCGTVSSSSRTSARIAAGSERPIRYCAFERPSSHATHTRSSPISSDATPSYTPDPVSCAPNSPPAASTRPISAATFSSSTAFTAVSGVCFTYRPKGAANRAASPLIWRHATNRE